MTLPLLCRRAACLLLVAVVGCNKESASPQSSGADGQGGATTSPTAPTATAAAADEVVGRWQAVKVETGSGGSLPDGLQKDILSAKTEIRPDHTYGSSNSMVGHSHGTWALNGNVVTLTPASGQRLLKAVNLTLEGQRLATHDGSLSVIYEKQGPVPADTGPKYHLTAEEFGQEVAKDEAAAKKKYDDVPIELTGVVTNIELRASGPYVAVAGPPPAGKDASDLFGGVQCSPLEPEPWATIARLQPVKVVGIATVAYGSGSLSEAKFTPDGPSVLVNISAEDLAGEYAKDPEAAKKKYGAGYHGKPMILTGPLLEKHIESGQPSVLVLGKGDSSVRCEYSNQGSDVAKALDPLQVGQTVKLAGEFSPSSSKDKVPALINCLLITK